MKVVHLKQRTPEATTAHHEGYIAGLQIAKELMKKYFAQELLVDVVRDIDGMVTIASQYSQLIASRRDQQAAPVPDTN